MTSAGHSEVRIHDTRAGEGNLLIPLSELVQRLEASFPSLRGSTWTILSAAAGYGEAVCQMEDELRESGPKDVSGMWLAELLAEDKEYFDDVEIRVDELGITFGICDSTFLYFRGPREVTERLATVFKTSEIAEP
jgi:hypothetical protein